MNKIQFILIILGVLIFSACEDSLLDPKIDATYAEDAIWTHPEKAQGVLYNAYGSVPGQADHWDGNNFLDAATDNACTNNFSSGLFRLTNSGMTQQSNPLDDWANCYNQFRNIHMFLENGLTDKITYNLLSEEADSLIRVRLEGEAYFLRAWWGFELLKRYGGMTDDGKAMGYIIVTSTFDEDSKDLANSAERNSYEACVTQILADCDKAIEKLPLTYTGSDPNIGAVNVGRASGEAAFALKARVGVYAASPAYQETNADVDSKWVRAASLAKEAIDEIGAFTSLNADLFNASATPSEFIWRQYHNNNSLESRNYPPAYFGSGITCPSQNLVDAFPMKNGYPIDHELSGYDPANPYANRDPRLDITVMHNGTTLDGRELETFEGGKDSKAMSFKATRTGYYLRKWLSVSKAGMLAPDTKSNDFHYHVLLRITEVYLNYAEALNEAFGPTTTGAGHDKTALEMVKEIRSKAGIANDVYADEVAANGKDAFRTLIQNERRLELAFENHRYFDVRRWMLPLNEPLYGMKISKDGDALVYEKVEVEQRHFETPRDYYMALPFSEVIKNDNMVNNLGWN